MRKRIPDAFHSTKTLLRITAPFIVMLFLAPTVGIFVSAQRPEERGTLNDVHPDGRSRGTIFYAPHGRGDLGENHDKGSAPPNSGNGIFYHGGPVILGGANIYYIWYGNWSTTIDNRSTAQPLLDNLAKYLDTPDTTTNPGSSINYFNIETTYYQSNPSGSVSDLVKLGGDFTVTNYPPSSTTYSKRLSDNDILTIVHNVIGSNKPNPNDIYFVLTSSDVTETSGFCSSYCAWHWSNVASKTSFINGVDVKYGFIGNAARCPSACEAQTTSPNNDAGVDSMTDSIAHEVEEFATDPDLNSWYDKRGNENADKCAWTYGSTKTASNGSKYNITLGGTPYLLQRNWVNANGGYCSMSY